MIHVAGLGHPHHGVDQQHAVHRVRGTLGQLLVHTVHRVAGLERHHVLPTERLQPLTRLGRGEAQASEIVMGRELYDL